MSQFLLCTLLIYSASFITDKKNSMLYCTCSKVEIPSECVLGYVAYVRPYWPNVHVFQVEIQ